MVWIKFSGSTDRVPKANRLHFEHTVQQKSSQEASVRPRPSTSRTAPAPAALRLAVDAHSAVMNSTTSISGGAREKYLAKRASACFVRRKLHN